MPLVVCNESPVPVVCAWPFHSYSLSFPFHSYILSFPFHSYSLSFTSVLGPNLSHHDWSRTFLGACLPASAPPATEGSTCSSKEELLELEEDEAEEDEDEEDEAEEDFEEYEDEDDEVEEEEEENVAE